MNPWVIIFMIVSSIFAVFSIAYVVVDVVLEALKREKPEPKPEPIPEPEPAPEPIPEPEPEPEPIPEPEPEPPLPDMEIIESAPVEIPEDLPVPESVEEGLEVIEVAWPESMAKNKIYRYDPDGRTFQRGDMVLVPTFDRHRHGAILRTATVINGNYRTVDFPADRELKKVVRKVDRKVRE